MDAVSNSTAPPSSSGEEPKELCDDERAELEKLRRLVAGERYGRLHHTFPGGRCADDCPACERTGLRERVKFTESFEAIRDELERLSLAASQGVSEKASPCANGHTWSMEFDADPERGTICDCGKKKWGERIAEIRVKTPEFDNHHNALACPYCNPNKLKFVEPAVGGSPEQKELRAASQAPSAPAVIREIDKAGAAVEDYCECGRPRSEHTFRDDKIYDVQELRCPNNHWRGEWRYSKSRTEAERLKAKADRLASLCPPGDR